MVGNGSPRRPCIEIRQVIVSIGFLASFAFMSDRSPPFTALRAVEAASRHRSFTGAARELQITHSAVSQSIRRLETDLGATLFERRGGAMEPSTAALRLAETYFQAQEAVNRAIREIADPEALEALVVAMPEALVRQWFSFKLEALGLALPDIEVEVRTRLDDPAAAVRLVWAPVSDPDAVYELSHVPVCHPELVRTLGIQSAQDVVRAPLIAGPDADWTAWAGTFLPGRRAPRAHAFDDAGLALGAATHGSGVTLANLFAAERYIEAGQLIALPFEAPTGRALAVRAEGFRAGGASDRFVSWLKLEIRRGAARLQAPADSTRNVSQT